MNYNWVLQIRELEIDIGEKDFGGKLDKAIKELMSSAYSA